MDGVQVHAAYIELLQTLKLVREKPRENDKNLIPLIFSFAAQYLKDIGTSKELNPAADIYLSQEFTFLSRFSQGVIMNMMRRNTTTKYTIQETKRFTSELAKIYSCANFEVALL